MRNKFIVICVCLLVAIFAEVSFALPGEHVTDPALLKRLNQEDRKAAELGDAGAQFSLGRRYYDGYGENQDYTEAVAWFHKAAEQGLAIAQRSLGYAYLYGQGVQIYDRESIKWFLKAANQGDADSQEMLGYAYIKGKGVTQDYVESFKWTRKAAEQGNSRAQSSLALYYDEGIGVTQDKVEAAKWYRKTAEHINAGSSVSQSIYASFCEEGRPGVKKDLVEALAWYTLSATEYQDAVYDRDRIQKKLSPKQVAAAQKLAKELFKKIQQTESTQKEMPKTTPAQSIAAILPPVVTIVSPDDGATVTPEPHKPVYPKNASEVLEIASKNTVVIKKLDAEGKIIGLGSGAVLPGGDIVTNCHVVEGAVNILVRSSGKDYPATLHHSDWDRDVCSVSSAGINQNTPVTLGSTKSLRIGKPVYAIGSPQGLELTLSDGIVSGLREVNGGNYIQTTAAISPGSSGGGLFDENGALVGLTTFYLTEGQNLNFAVPVEWITELPKHHNNNHGTSQPAKQ